MIEIEEIKLASGEMQSKPKSNAFETLLRQVAKEKEKMKQAKDQVNLDPRSDLSTANEMMDELVEAVARKSKVSTTLVNIHFCSFSMRFYSLRMT